MVTEAWLKYLHDDLEERDKRREAHLRAMQKRHFE